ncbi:MAG: S24 family peptidase [Vampirovibrionales bacterium]|nr:S24 family peptidase [Vampirovibrionales bacterium]
MLRKTLTQLIESLHRSQNLSAWKLAKQAGVAYPALKEALDGKRPFSDDTLQKLAAHPAIPLSEAELRGLRLAEENSLADLKAALTAKGTTFNAPQGSYAVSQGAPEGFYRFPCKGTVAAGQLQMVDTPEDPDNLVYYEWHSIETYSPDMFCLQVRGNSMYPPVPDGAILLVRPAAQLKHKGWYVVLTTDGLGTFKMLSFNQPKACLMPLNPAHDPVALGAFDISRVFEVIEVKFKPGNT